MMVCICQPWVTRYSETKLSRESVTSRAILRSKPLFFLLHRLDTQQKLKHSLLPTKCQSVPRQSVVGYGSAILKLRVLSVENVSLKR